MSTYHNRGNKSHYSNNYIDCKLIDSHEFNRVRADPIVDAINEGDDVKINQLLTEDKLTGKHIFYAIMRGVEQFSTIYPYIKSEELWEKTVNFICRMGHTGLIEFLKKKGTEFSEDNLIIAIKFSSNHFAVDMILKNIKGFAITVDYLHKLFYKRGIEWSRINPMVFNSLLSAMDLEIRDYGNISSILERVNKDNDNDAILSAHFNFLCSDAKIDEKIGIYIKDGDCAMLSAMILAGYKIKGQDVVDAIVQQQDNIISVVFNNMDKSVELLTETLVKLNFVEQEYEGHESLIEDFLMEFKFSREEAADLMKMDDGEKIEYINSQYK